MKFFSFVQNKRKEFKKVLNKNNNEHKIKCHHVI